MKPSKKKVVLLGFKGDYEKAVQEENGPEYGSKIIGKK